ncbi:MFS transporter [Actinoallomurus acaciae]|uniref:MFS transporter n=1 Tax=Actinoallomurus acaciae TaxID=502577 RepID=A0ABV5YL57_9ACTN
MDESASIAEIGAEQAREAGGENAVSPARTGMILATVCLVQLMVVLDVSVVNVALPSIDRALGFSAGALSWVVNAYTLVFGGLLLLGGRVADLVGARRAVLTGLGLFALASVLGGFAQDPGQLIAARAGQGLAGAVLAPVSLVIIMVTFPEGPVRSRAIGVWAMVAASGSAVGVLLGGLLTDLLDWRWVLFVNVPIVAVAFALALRSVPGTRRTGGRRLDVVGSVLGTAAVALLVYAMVEAGERGWGSGVTVTALVLTVVCAVLFGAWEQWVAAEPLVRPGLVGVRTVWVATLVVAFIGAATIAGFYFASLFLQDVLGYSPLRAGVAFLPFCAGVVLGAFASGPLAARWGNRLVISGGLLLGAVGMLLFSRLQADSTFLSGFVLPSVVASAGIGACMVANTSMGISGVAHHESGMASGLINAARQCGGSIGLAALSTVAVSAAPHATAPNTAQALVHGYDRAFLVAGLCVLVAAAVAAIFVPSRSPGRPEPATGGDDALPGRP